MAIQALCIVANVVQNETVLEVAAKSRSMWVLQRIKSAAIARGLDKSASLLERTISNPVCFTISCSSCYFVAQYC